MFALLVTLLILDALVLSVVVLLQAGQGGGLASLGGGAPETVLGGRQAVTILTKATWWTGGIFLALSLILSVVSANRRPGGSAIQERLRATQPTAPSPSAGLPLQTTPPAGQAATPAPNAPATAPGNAPANAPATGGAKPNK